MQKPIIKNEEVVYKVIISDEVSFNEFYKKYEILQKEGKIYTITERKAIVPIAKLKREYWGNHDGRYNMLCSNCGWRSTDIHPGDTEPTECPVCDN